MHCHVAEETQMASGMQFVKRLRFGVAMAVALVVPAMMLFVLPEWLLIGCVALVGMWFGFTRIGQQTWSLTWVGISTIPKRPGTSAVVVAGIAGVVAVLIALLAMGAGFEATLKQAGSDDSAIILQAGARSELNSAITPEATAVVSQAPQVLRNAADQPIVSPELVLTAMLPSKSGHDANVVIRGVGKRVWELWSHIRVSAGRNFTPGLQELIVGKGIYEQFAGIHLGSMLMLNNQSWKVVGTFDSADAHNSEIWADTDVVGSVFRRESNKSSLRVKLTDVLAFDALRDRLSRDPRLKVDVETTRQYFVRQSSSFTHIIHILGTAVGAIMAFGAVFGVLNTMHSAVAARTREIATLRAIGFRRVPMIAAVLLETMLLAVIGGAIGATAAWVIFDGFIASTVVANSSQMV